MLDRTSSKPECRRINTFLFLCTSGPDCLPVCHYRVCSVLSTLKDPDEKSIIALYYNTVYIQNAHHKQKLSNQIKSNLLIAGPATRSLSLSYRRMWGNVMEVYWMGSTKWTVQTYSHATELQLMDIVWSLKNVTAKAESVQISSDTGLSMCGTLCLRT